MKMECGDRQAGKKREEGTIEKANNTPLQRGTSKKKIEDGSSLTCNNNSEHSRQ